MRRLGRFGWDAANSRHVERRGVSPREAGEVILEQPLFRRTRCDRFIAYGRTVDGRYLTVIFCLKQGDIVRVITAQAMTTPVNGDTMREGVITTRRRIPKFNNESEEAEFWATHDTMDYIDDTEPVEFEIDPRLRNEARSRSRSRFELAKPGEGARRV